MSLSERTVPSTVVPLTRLFSECEAAVGMMEFPLDLLVSFLLNII